MGNLRSKSKRKKISMGCSSSTKQESDAAPDFEEEPKNPTDLKVLYEAIREADALRQNDLVEHAVIILSNAFDSALSKLGEVPDELHQDTVLLMQVMKECNSAWKHKNVAYNPPYRRLRHLKLDGDHEDDGDENPEPLPPQHQHPEAAAADQKADEPQRPLKKNRPLKKKSPIKFDDSNIETKPITPIEVKKDAKPLFSSGSISFITQPANPETLYMNLWRADQLRIDDQLEAALEIVSDTFDDCIHNLHAAKKSDKKTINIILQVLRETQHHWEVEDDYSPDFDRLRNLGIHYHVSESEV